MSRLDFREPDICEAFDGLFPPECERELIVMLKVFADGSQTYPDGSAAPAFTVAGFLAEKIAWHKFQKAWRKARRSAEIEHFHMADYEARSERHGYDKWSEAKREAVLNRLIQLVSDTVVVGFAATMLKADYDALTSEQKVNLCHDNPYSFCANEFLGMMSAYILKAMPKEKAIYVFEVGDKGEAEFRKSMYEQMEKLPVHNETMRILSYVPGTKKDFPHLDAADFLAWEVNRDIPKYLGNDKSPRRESLEKLTNKTRIGVRYYPYVELAKFADAAPQEDAELIARLGCRVIPPNPKKPYTW